MTIRQALEKHLFDFAMLMPDEIATIMERYIANPMNAAAVKTLNQDVSSYPAVYIASCKMTIGYAAVAWMDECCPGHFARTMFA